VKFPNSPDHNLLITLQVDPITQRMFAYSVLLFDSAGELVDDFDVSCCVQLEEAAEMEDFTALTIAFTMDLHRTLAYLEQQQSRTVIFIRSDRERKYVQDVLIRCIAVEKNVSPEEQQAAKQVLLTLFNDTQMLLVDSDNIPEMLQQSSAGLKVTIIEEILRENVAIPVPGYYRFQDWSNYLLPNNTTIMIEDDIYAKWESGEDVNPYLETTARTLLNIIQAFRELANLYAKSCTNTKTLFLLSPDVLQFVPTLTFKSSYLGKLCFFKMLETITACEKLRLERFKGFGDESETRGGIHLNFVGYEEVSSPKKKIKSIVARFQVLPKNSDDRPMDTLKISSMLEYIVVEDSDQVNINCQFRTNEKDYTAHFSYVGVTESHIVSGPQVSIANEGLKYNGSQCLRRGSIK
jgi:hypothetical protein